MKIQRKRTHNLRRIRAGHIYSVHEICNLLGIHKNTVRDWTRRGLSRIDDHRPYMYHGSTLKEYLQLKQSSRKYHCKPDELPCFRCRQPRRARQGVIDITIRTAKIINLGGICEQCSCPVNKRASVKKLADIAGIFTIRAMHDNAGHLIDATAFNQLIGTPDCDPAKGKP